MRVFTSVYLLLLAYTIAALVYWGLLLEKQNRRIFNQEVIILQQTVDSTQHAALYTRRYAGLQHENKLHKSQYIGEGATFMLVIMIGAVVVWSSFRRSIRLSRQQNNFMLSVTHELKSPIAAMKLNMQTLEKYQLDEEKRNQLLDRCIKEANRLNDLCNNMLFASQLEGRQYKPALERFNFSELVAYSVKEYQQRYPGRFIATIAEDHMLNGDRVMLQMAINNLLENAVKYTPADKPVLVTLADKASDILLQVADNGTGITEEEKKKVFNKFYRVGNEESRKTKGTGLGLYLTKKIIMQHKGRISIKDNQPNGTVFEITLPLS